MLDVAPSSLDDATIDRLRPFVTAKWCLDDLIKLVSLARLGVSTTTAARMFTPARTRNSVIGKANRMTDDGVIIRFASEPPKVSGIRASTPETVSRETPASFARVVHVPGPKTLVDLTPVCCRFPLGDDLPSDKSFRFCGQKKIVGIPYCSDHAKTAYTTSTENQTRDNLTC